MVCCVIGSINVSISLYLYRHTQCFACVVIGFELGASCILDKHSTSVLHPQPNTDLREQILIKTCGEAGNFYVVAHVQGTYGQGGKTGSDTRQNRSSVLMVPFTCAQHFEVYIQDFTLLSLL